VPLSKDKLIMPDFNKTYLNKYVLQAENTDNPAIRADALYRVGTHLELDGVLECNGDTNLTPQQQQAILTAAKQALDG
jgi:hypothetical protein